MKIGRGRQTAIPIPEITSKKMRSLAREVDTNRDDVLQRSENPQLFDVVNRFRTRGGSAGFGAWVTNMFPNLSGELLPTYSLLGGVAANSFIAGTIAAGLRTLGAGRRNLEAVRKSDKTIGQGVADTAREGAIAGGAGATGAAIGAAIGRLGGRVTLGPAGRVAEPLAWFIGATVGYVSGIALDRLAHRVVSPENYGG